MISLFTVLFLIGFKGFGNFLRVHLAVDFIVDQDDGSDTASPDTVDVFQGEQHILGGGGALREFEIVACSRDNPGGPLDVTDRARADGDYIFAARGQMKLGIKSDDTVEFRGRDIGPR